MRNKGFLNTVSFVAFVFLQVLILNNISFLGYITPYLYIAFILFLPVDMSRWKVLFLAFITGLTIDIFGDSGGIHAAACTVIAYLRPTFLRTAFGLSYDNHTISFYKSPAKERLTYILLMTLTHHFILFSLVFFDFSHILLILKNTLFTGIFTTLLLSLTIVLLRRSKKSRR